MNASVHDSQEFDELSDEVYSSLYIWLDTVSIRDRGGTSRASLQEPYPPHRKYTAWVEPARVQGKSRCSKVRARVEHVFDVQLVLARQGGVLLRAKDNV